MLQLYFIQVLYDKRVRVVFQKKAWCDEEVMMSWQSVQWAQACDGDMLLVLDVHRAQVIDQVRSIFASNNTTPVYVPPVCTSIIQPLDVSFNTPFKAAVSRLANQHVAENLTRYVQGSIPAGERRVLFMQWVGQEWEELSQNMDMIRRSFQKCGIAVPIDGSSDAAIHLEGVLATLLVVVKMTKERMRTHWKWRVTTRLLTANRLTNRLF